LILYLIESGIQRIVIHKDFQKEELIKFISLLTAPKGEKTGDLHGLLLLEGVKNIEVGKIRAHSLEEKEKIEKTPIPVSDDALDKLSESVAKVLNDEAIDYLDLRFNILNFMEYFTGRHQELLNLISMKKKDLATFLHLLNVSLLSMYFSSKLGYSKDDVLDIGVAGLFHDIGKLSLARKLIKKKEKLKEEEFAQIKHHSILGAKLLLMYVESLGTLPVVTAFEHHTRYDLRGYPRLTFPYKAHPISAIIAICDVYDALHLKRTYKKDYPPNKIYRIMIKERGKYFDPDLLDHFFNHVGVWPVGAIVSLSDGRIAVVREQNKKDIQYPRIEVISPPDKTEMVDLLVAKKHVKIDYALNSFKEGKKYLDLI
jgi:HD-GYP domain-containing protein (c-di-GMP phosphodiesterase class II)